MLTLKERFIKGIEGSLTKCKYILHNNGHGMCSIFISENQETQWAFEDMIRFRVGSILYEYPLSAVA
jgi:hypothetical protein